MYKPGPVITHKKCRVLIVDDDELVRDIVGSLLTKNGHEVCEAESVDTALAKLKNFHADVIISDFNMPEKTGVELYIQIKRKRRKIPFLFLTGTSTPNITEGLSDNENLQVLYKPVRANVLLGVVSSLSQHCLAS